MVIMGIRRNFVLITFCSILILLLPFCLGLSYPHGFYGTAKFTNGNNIPNGYLITGEVNGVISGSCTISDGEYDLVITDEKGTGGTIKFYINGEQADQTSVFSAFSVTYLNLTIASAPVVITGCGDNICNLSECSTCSIDCSYSECNSNGRCDTEIGEACSNAPLDCGVCVYCGDNICNNGETCSTCSQDCGACPASPSSGTSDTGGTSSGGGGGSSSSSSTRTNNTNTTETQANNPSNNDEIKSIEQLNEVTNSKQNIKPGITGAVIGFVKNIPLTIGIGLVAIIIVVLTAYLVKRRRYEN